MEPLEPHDEAVRVPGRLAEVLAGRAACLFLSPHLDDAVLSCGAMMTKLAGHRAPTVATVFTTADGGPHTYAARSFHRQCKVGDARTLFAERRTEDREVLADIGADPVHLGLTDALYRLRDVRIRGARGLRRLVPELVHRYPTYRFDIARGRMARGDRHLVAGVATKIADLISSTGATVLFCPIGVGRHVDHLIVRAAGQEFAERVVFYSDFPYNTFNDVDVVFIARHRLRPWQWTTGVPEKGRSIQGYRTQAAAMFPDGRIPVVAETYYVPSR